MGGSPSFLQPVTDLLARTVTGVDPAEARDAIKGTIVRNEKTAGERAQLNSLSTNKNVDSITKREIAQGLAEAGNNNNSIDALIERFAAAGSGTGVFAARKVNEAQRQVQRLYPGRAQLSPTLGSSSPIGSF